MGKSTTSDSRISMSCGRSGSAGSSAAISSSSGNSGTGGTVSISAGDKSSIDWGISGRLKFRAGSSKSSAGGKYLQTLDIQVSSQEGH